MRAHRAVLATGVFAAAVSSETLNGHTHQKTLRHRVLDAMEQNYTGNDYSLVKLAKLEKCMSDISRVPGIDFDEDGVGDEVPQWESSFQTEPHRSFP